MDHIEKFIDRTPFDMPLNGIECIKLSCSFSSYSLVLQIGVMSKEREREMRVLITKLKQN